MNRCTPSPVRSDGAGLRCTSGATLARPTAQLATRELGALAPTGAGTDPSRPWTRPWGTTGHLENCLSRVPPTPGRSRGPWHMHGGQRGFHSPAACLAVERRFEFAPRILPRTAAALPLRCFPSRALCVVLFFSCAAAAAIASSWALSTAVPPQKTRERARAKAQLRRKVEGRSEWFRAPCVRLASCSAARRSPEPGRARPTCSRSHG